MPNAKLEPIFDKNGKRIHPGIYRRGGSYVVTFRDLHGRQRKRFARTIKEAEHLKEELRTDVRRREYREETRMTFVDYAGEWITSYNGRTSSGLRDVTRNDYRQRLGLDEEGRPRLDVRGRGMGAVGFFGRRQLAEIQPRDLKEFAKKLAASGLAPNTVRLHLAPVKAMLATAFEDGLIRVNPAANVRIAPAQVQTADDEDTVKALTEDELRALLAEVRCVPCQREAKEECGECERWRLFFEFLAHSGLRIGEASALQWEHVDLGRCRVLVRRRWYRGTFAPPKSKYGRRTVPLSPGMAKALWRLRGSATDHELVFASEAGTVIDQSNTMTRILKPAAVRAGIGEWVKTKDGRRAETWVGFHTFRHTCATTLFRKGLNAKQAQVWLGHHSPAFTLATYVHLLADDLPDAAFLDVVTASKVGNEGATGRDENGLDPVGLDEAESPVFPDEPRISETAAASF